MSSSKKGYRDYLELFRLVVSGSVSALVPLANYFLRFLPAPLGRESMYAALAIMSAGFAVPWVYVIRQFLWDWHTGVLSLKSRQRELDVEIYKVGLNPSTTSQLDVLSVEYQNLLLLMKRRYQNGGGVRIQVVSLILFLLAMLSLAFYLSLADLYPLAPYCVAFASMSGAFAVIALVILGRPPFRKKFEIPQSESVLPKKQEVLEEVVALLSSADPRSDVVRILADDAIGWSHEVSFSDTLSRLSSMGLRGEIRLREPTNDVVKWFESKNLRYAGPSESEENIKMIIVGDKRAGIAIKKGDVYNRRIIDDPETVRRFNDFFGQLKDKELAELVKSIMGN